MIRRYLTLVGIVLFISSCSIEQQSFDIGEEFLAIDYESANNSIDILHYPVFNFDTSITLKPFGIYITPQDSPVQPEKFRGYHNAVDVEVPDSMLDEDVWVYAVSDCKLVVSRTVSGYGGVIVIVCEIDDEDYTVLYGHVDINSVLHDVGDFVGYGERLAILGEGYSSKTDGERKHLHFSIKKGVDFDLSGYVQTEDALMEWIDPVKFFERYQTLRPSQDIY